MEVSVFEIERDDADRADLTGTLSQAVVQRGFCSSFQIRPLSSGANSDRVMKSPSISRVANSTDAATDQLVDQGVALRLRIRQSRRGEDQDSGGTDDEKDSGRITRVAASAGAKQPQQEWP